MITDLEKQLVGIGLQEGVIKNALQNKKVVEKLKKVLEVSKTTTCPKAKGEYNNQKMIRRTFIQDSH